LFGGDPSGKTSTAGAPRVEADSVNMQLMVAGTPAQVDSIKAWLQKMGEIPGGGPGNGVVGAERDQNQAPYRVLPISGRIATKVMDQLQSYYPQVSGVRLNVVRESGDSLTTPPDQARPTNGRELRPRTPQDARPVDNRTRPAPTTPSATPAKPDAKP